MNAYRTVLEADLAPLAGALFQPTGFPDLGRAEFGDHALLVESAQSMANWLEGTTWDGARADQVAELGAPALRPGRQPRRCLPFLQQAGGAPARVGLRDGRQDRWRGGP